MNLFALRKLVEHVYKALSSKGLIALTGIREELAKTGFETEHVSSNTLLWQVAYGVVLKLILYGLAEKPYNLPSLSELNIGDLAKAFEEAYRASNLIAFKPSWIDRGYHLLSLLSYENFFERPSR
jgi:hypothetical protein